jgi:predicted enzyme related to lactoylglutathione lyase
MNPVTWFSIPAEDTKRSAAFYRQAFGWQVEPLTEETNDVFDYNVVVNSDSNEQYVSNEKGRLNGCIVKKATGIAHPVVLVEVEDLDEAARKIVAAGGSVVSAKIPMKSLNGVFILAKDPEGNLVEIFRPN